ncbi:MAG: hypothetical protein PHD67_00905 [Oscillospiraceae bacterium]|nr:hypothetical protein [Oscillospiraceae bacterium]
MERKDNRVKIRKGLAILFWVLFGATLLLVLILGAQGAVATLQEPATSFPWWSSYAFMGLYFSLPLLAELILSIVFTALYRSAKRQAEENGGETAK